MQHRSFGTTNLQVSQLGLGCARIGGIFKYGAAELIELLHTAQRLGINFFDTSDMYCQGESEQLIGRAFRKRRHEIVIASKVGYILPGQRKLIARVKPLVRPLIRLLGVKRSQLPAVVRGTPRQSFEPRYLIKAVEGSLRRLRTDHLDLLQLHSPPAEVIEHGAWLGALEQLRRAGKTRYFGISCDTVAAANAALAVPGLSSLQVVVNLFEREHADQVIAAAHKRGIAIIARECLANGVLAKAERDIDLAAYCSTAEQVSARRDALKAYRDTARTRGISISALALEYASTLPGVAVALVGASRADQLRETVQAFQGLQHATAQHA
jgi:aryl-alcohol dehydrogenase-like predicted oxidoreductase